jgi:acetylglutamate kinase
VGISGIDGGLVTARQVSKELQFTGKPVAADGRLLDLLLSAGYLPVIACVAGDPQGTVYNVNADQLAVSCAVGWRAAKLFFLTDVPGVKGEDGAIIPSLTRADVANLVSTGVAHGGMQAKLESCVCALESGVPHVVIASGQTGEICRDLIAGELRGTSITLQEAGVA